MVFFLFSCMILPKHTFNVICCFDYAKHNFKPQPEKFICAVDIELITNNNNRKKRVCAFWHKSNRNQLHTVTHAKIACSSGARTHILILKQQQMQFHCLIFFFFFQMHGKKNQQRLASGIREEEKKPTTLSSRNSWQIPTPINSTCDCYGRTIQMEINGEK